MSGGDVLNSAGQALPVVKAVADLNGFGGPGGDALPVGEGAVAAGGLDARVLAEPSSELFRVASFPECEREPGGGIGQKGAVDAAAERGVGPQHPGCHQRRQRHLHQLGLRDFRRLLMSLRRYGRHWFNALMSAVWTGVIAASGVLAGAALTGILGLLKGRQDAADRERDRLESRRAQRITTRHAAHTVFMALSRAAIGEPERSGHGPGIGLERRVGRGCLRSP